MSPVLEMRDLWVEAVSPDGPRTPIVRGIDLRVERGEVLALIGESGSGKTTVALAALAYTRPGLEVARGQVLLNGHDLLRMPPEAQRSIRGRRVAYLAQSAAAAFNPAIPIGEQVIESALLHGAMARPDAEARAAELYRALELPDPDRIGRRYPHQVSGGQLQRLMAAMALCGRPDLLVLDEPTTALDVTTQIEVLKAFKSVIRDQGAAAIYVTHDLPVVAQIADRILVLRSGEIQESGPTGQIIRRPRHEYTRQLIAAVRPAPDARSASGAEAGDGPPALTLAGVTAGYGPVVEGRPASTVLHNIDLTVGRGRVVGVIGESGCGKSTLARVMAGLLPAAAGELRLGGQPLDPDLRRRTREQLRLVQIVFQMADTALNPRQRIGDIIGRPLRFYRGLAGRRQRARVAELLQMVELPPAFAARYPDELSGGQKQRVNLARALAAEPAVLLCDEVTSALDTLVGAHVIDLLRRLRSDTGAAMVFISHDLSTVTSFADEIVVLYAGRVVERGSVARAVASLASLHATADRLRPRAAPRLARGDARRPRAWVGHGPERQRRCCWLPLRGALSAGGPWPLRDHRAAAESLCRGPRGCLPRGLGRARTCADDRADSIGRVTPLLLDRTRKPRLMTTDHATKVLSHDAGPGCPLELVEHIPDLLREEHGFGGFLFDRDGRVIVEDGSIWLYTTRLADGRWDSWVRHLDLATLRAAPARRILMPEPDHDRAVLHHIVQLAGGLIVGFYCDGLGFSAAIADAPDSDFVRDPGFAVRPETGWETRYEQAEGWSLECNGAWVPDSPTHGGFWLGYDSYRRDGRLGDLGWIRVEIDVPARAVHVRERHAKNPLAFRSPEWSCVRCGGNLASDVTVRGRRAFFYYIRPDQASFKIGMALSHDPLFVEGVEHHVIGGALAEEDVAEKFQAIPRGNEISCSTRAATRTAVGVPACDATASAAEAANQVGRSVSRPLRTWRACGIKMVRRST